MPLQIAPRPGKKLWILWVVISFGEAKWSPTTDFRTVREQNVQKIGSGAYLEIVKLMQGKIQKQNIKISRQFPNSQ